MVVRTARLVAAGVLIVTGVIVFAGFRAEAFPGLSLELPSIQWGASKRPDESTRFWDPEVLVGLGTNVVSVYYRPLDQNGNYRGATWVIPPSLLTSTLASAQPELRETHAHGIKVIGYGDTIQFNADVLRSENLDPENYYALDVNGRKVSCNGWDASGNYLSCVNNPNWLSLQKQINIATAKAGIDAIQFDLYPYAVAPGYNCHCLYCKSAWRGYSRKRFGTAKAMPGSTLNLACNPIDRAYLEWRLSCISGFLKSIQKSVRAVKPSFSVLQNNNVDFVDFVHAAMQGGFDQPSTEISQVSLGGESSLYLYRMVEAVNGASLYSLCNSPAQYSPISRLRVALAEAFAGGGAMHAPAESNCKTTVSSYLGFVRANQNLYTGTKSDASVSILFSWRDHAYLQNPSKGESQIMDWSHNSCRRAAAVLARMGVPYDYVIVERGLSKARLARYRVIVTPELRLLDDADAAVLKAYVRGGGRLLSIGDLGTLKQAGEDYAKRSPGVLTGWTARRTGAGYWATKLGSGRAAYVPAAMTGDNEQNMAISPEFRAGAAYVGLDSQLKITDSTTVEATIRSKGGQKIIHLIRMELPEDTADKSAQLDYKVPDNQRVVQVEARSPDCPAHALEPSWSVSGGWLSVRLGQLYTYTVVCVSFTSR